MDPFMSPSTFMDLFMSLWARPWAISRLLRHIHESVGPRSNT